MRPTDILKNEHRVIEQVLHCLEVIAQRAAFGAALDVASARQVLDFFRHFADTCHHGKEERCLFPAMEARGFPREHGPTGVMRSEHVEGRQHIAAMAAALDDADSRRFVQHAWAYIELLSNHIFKEDHRQALSPADHERLLDAFAHVESDVRSGRGGGGLSRSCSL